MKIYTKTGDDGTTGLFNGQRVKKSHRRVELYGTVDELNSILGLAIASKPHELLKPDLERISNLLFNLGTDLATPLEPPPKFEVTRLDYGNIGYLEKLIDNYDESLEPLKNFILPGGSMASAFLHQCRTVCRRAERLAVVLSETEELGDVAVKLLNRLSDYFFAAARYANHLAGVKDKLWEK